MLDFGNAANFKWEVFIETREQHETEEATSAVTYRYKQAESEGVIESVTASLGSNPTSDSEGAGKSDQMKASIITGIARVISASLTSTAKPDTTGLERRARWQGLGILVEDEISNPKETVDQSLRNDSASIARQNVYMSLSSALPLSFATAGLQFHPLKHGSWVLVSYLDSFWLGTGE